MVMVTNRASLLMLRKEDEQETLSPPESGGESGKRSGNEGGGGFIDSYHQQGPEVQLQTEEWSTAHTVTGLRRKWIHHGLTHLSSQP